MAKLMLATLLSVHGVTRALNPPEYIVVGTGAAGSVAAARLAAQGFSVLALEAGKGLQAVNGGDLAWGTFEDTGQVATVYDVPGLASLPPAPKDHFWDFPNFHHTKGVGGDGVHNGMTYLRAAKEDFDELSDAYNLSGWGWDDVLPFYKKSEQYLGTATNVCEDATPATPDPLLASLSAAFGKKQ
jgi:choline dehydrogenase-like flavoprotein